MDNLYRQLALGQINPLVSIGMGSLSPLSGNGCCSRSSSVRLLRCYEVGFLLHSIHVLPLLLLPMFEVRPKIEATMIFSKVAC